MGSATAARIPSPAPVERHHDDSECFHLKRRFRVAPSEVMTRSSPGATGVGLIHTASAVSPIRYATTTSSAYAPLHHHFPFPFHYWSFFSDL
ncbi:unnamed protein product [Eruca vesicaria subsp. sativa]|uniref:Uncharacterized protein n=1 Tax=Eruca vesicaria subsp. sativa TaxID=29727 RepID=A0ABC8KPM1_ERUVS|nr:unnamed protein product [Eruca vesicaria subsp. sativa]